MIGSTIGKYRVVAQLGRGGMGTVYRAVDETLGRDVALKILNADHLSPESLQRFRAEAVTLARLNHPRIAVIHELAREGDGFMMVMEYVGGETFEKLMSRTGQLPLSRALVLCDEVLDALEHAHAEGIVHRDLKPSNVMVTRSGDVKVMDFGIARVAGTEHLTSDGFMMGTPAYMPPEQVRGEEVDRRMDLYAVAVVLYRMLTGRLPFEAAAPIALIHAQLNNPPTPPRQHRADLPDWLEEVLTRGLAKTPDERFQTAAEFRLALERGLAGSPGTRQVAGDDQETIAPTPSRLPVAQSDVHPTPKTTPAPTGSAPLDATVTLRTPHLVAAGAFILLLVIGVGVLAYVAFRRSVPAAPTATAETAAPIATPAAASEPPVATAEPPAVGAPTTTSPSATAAVAPSKVAPPAPPTIPPKPDQVSASRGAVAPAPAPAVASPATASPAAETASRSEPVSPPLPAAAVAPESFGDIRTIITDGGRSKEVDALLNLESDRAILRSRDNGAVLQAIPYRSIAASTYAHARRPRGKEEDGLAPLPKDLGNSGFLIRTSKHWLTLQSKSSFVVLRLEDKNVMAVISSIESRTGAKVQRFTDADK